MKLVYTSENKILVDNAKNYLSENGIESILRNEYSAGGMGELSPLETWPELWVADDVFLQARDVLQSLFDDEQGRPWFCTNCSEENEASFEICWRCQTERQASA